METNFQIPTAPVPASRPKVSRFATYYPKKHTAYHQFLKGFLSEVECTASEGPVEVRFLFVMPRYKTSDHLVHRSDVDNLSKLPLDCMTQSKVDENTSRFWKDDDLVVNLMALKRFTRDGEEPHTKVRILPITGSVEDHTDRAFFS